MPHRLLSPYQHRDSPIHRLGTGVKLGAALAFVVIVVMLPFSAWPAYAVGGGVLLLLAALSRLPARELIRKLLWVEPFALGVALLSLLQRNGVHIFLTLLTRSTLCLFCMVLLASTTRFTDLLLTLRRAHFPALLLTTLALMHRYIFLLGDEMGRLVRARRCRTFSRDRLGLWRIGVTVIAQLLVRTFERAERIYAAMCARGWKT